MTSTEVVTERMSSEERARILESEVSDQVRRGWRVVSQTGTQAQLVKGKPTSHVLHFFIGIFTLSLWWIFVWIPLAIFGGEKHKHLTVDERGRVSRT